ncbi:DUF418 domain-containing protein [Lentzea albidocapillata]|uniref:Uncharacterized membrane protein YeiB n=1 Tax=Lentzea albidocapillata TaxID=40571 RepID=A0A1W2FBC5_9PSEU|nr:DUF418 domain-containing protein [Lentzea albidocapillata]SMD19279.1 Uncharacterized membrane protein YeiB [Lentzea albidocapillata]
MTTERVSTGRSLAPDLARGLMLLLIALAHAPGFLSSWRSGMPVLDDIALFVKSLIADNQARAMFVFLFGYGMGQLAHRHHARGGDWPGLRALLRRRSIWLVLIGFAHTILLVPIDIVAIYGLALLLFTPLVRATDRTLGWTAALTLVPATLLLAWQSVNAQLGIEAGAPVTFAAFMEPAYAAHVLANLTKPAEALLGVVMVLPGMLLGVWAARRRYLDRPAEHRTTLRRTTLGLLTLALIGRLPAALLAAGVWHTDTMSLQWMVAVAHDLTGFAGGIGLAAAVGLASARIGDRPGGFTTALAALGQRSLTFYLVQSAVWLALFYPFTFNLRDEVSVAGSYGIAAVVFVVSVLLAEWMRRTGQRGPMEVLLRRMSYPRPTASNAASP